MSVNQQVVFKYAVKPFCAKAKFAMPVGAKVLKVANQYNDIAIWAQHTPDPTGNTAYDLRQFAIVGTGMREIDPSWVYIDTVFLHDGALVFHVYEVPAS